MGRFFNLDPWSKKYPYNSTFAFQENKMGLGRELEGLELLQDRGMIITTGMTQYDVYPRYHISSYVSSYTLKPEKPDPQSMDTDELPSGAAGMGKWNNADGSFSSFAGEAKATKALGIFEVIKLAGTAMDGIEGMNKTGDYVKAVKYMDKISGEFKDMKTPLDVVNKSDLQLDNKTKTEITNYVFDGSLPKDINTRNNSVVNLSSKSNIINTGNSIMRKNGIIVRNSPEVKKRKELEQQRMDKQNKQQNVGR